MGLPAHEGIRTDCMSLIDEEPSIFQESPSARNVSVTYAYYYLGG